MKVWNVEIPEWMEKKITDEKNPSVGYQTFADVFSILLKDYITRNQPCEHNYTDRAYWDYSSASEKVHLECVRCGHQKEIVKE